MSAANSPPVSIPTLSWSYGPTNPPVGTLLSPDKTRTPYPADENDQHTQRKLFHQLTIGKVTLKNRIVVSPMCQYTSTDGFMTDYHLVHLGQYALGGAGLVITEASAVAPEGRISPHDAGIWKDEHIPQLARITDFIHTQRAAAGIQIAHAGRKASTIPPFLSTGRQAVDAQSGSPYSGWPADVVGPSSIPWDNEWIQPLELSHTQIITLVQQFADAAVRAHKAGFDYLELHAAHGYLMSEFLSPLANQRADEYGGSLENRARFVLAVTRAVRAVWPRDKILGIRLSCVDWVDGGFTLEECITTVGWLIDAGIDVVDCSSGGQHPAQNIPVGPGFQVFAAEALKKAYGSRVIVATVGMLTDATQCEAILQNNQADLILLAREFLRNPFWTLKAAKELGVNIAWAPQYSRAKI